MAASWTAESSGSGQEQLRGVLAESGLNDECRQPSVASWEWKTVQTEN